MARDDDSDASSVSKSKSRSRSKSAEKDDDGSKWNSEPWKWQTAEQIAVTMADPDNQRATPASV